VPKGVLPVLYQTTTTIACEHACLSCVQPPQHAMHVVTDARQSKPNSKIRTFLNACSCA
jgi:hypothetical protein